MALSRARLTLIAYAVACILSSGCLGMSPPVAATAAAPTTAPSDMTHPPDPQSTSATESTAPSNIPPGSGDYSAVLALATSYKNDEISFDQLQEEILARGLPPHQLGDDYLMIPVPQPPPGHDFNPRMMPKDWESTWGELAMSYWLGALTQAEYDKLHQIAHPGCVKK